MAGYSIEKLIVEAKESARRTKTNFDAIFEKYSRELVDDDIIDLNDGEFFVEKGYVRKSKKASFGTAPLATTKRREDNKANYMSGNESDINDNDVKVESFEHSNADSTLWQDLVQSFIKDPGNEPSDAETISSGCSSSSRITDDEGTDEDDDEDDDRCSSPVIIRNEPLDSEEEGEWYSMSKFNNYNSRQSNDPLKPFASNLPNSSDKSSINTEIISSHHVSISPSRNVKVPVKKRIVPNTLQLYTSRPLVNKMASSYKPQQFPNYSSESSSYEINSSNDITIVSSNDDSVVGSDDTETNPTTVIPDYRKVVQRKTEINLNSNNSTDTKLYTENKSSPLTPRRKLKAKKTSLHAPRFQIFSNVDLQAIFESNSSDIPAKVMSPQNPGVILNLGCNSKKFQSGTLPTYSTRSPTNVKKTDKNQSNAVTLITSVNQKNSQERTTPQPIGSHVTFDDENLKTSYQTPLQSDPYTSRSLDETYTVFPRDNPDDFLMESSMAVHTAFPNLVLSPSSQIASLRLRETPEITTVRHNCKTHTPLQQSDTHRSNSLDRGEMTVFQFKSANPVVHFEKPSSNSTFALPIERSKQCIDSHRNSIDVNKFQQCSSFVQSAAPLTCDNLRIFNEINDNPFDLCLSPKRLVRGNNCNLPQERPSSVCNKPPKSLLIPKGLVSSKSNMCSINSIRPGDVLLSPKRPSSVSAQHYFPKGHCNATLQDKTTPQKHQTKQTTSTVQPIAEPVSLSKLQVISEFEGIYQNIFTNKICESSLEHDHSANSSQEFTDPNNGAPIAATSSKESRETQRYHKTGKPCSLIEELLLKSQLSKPCKPKICERNRSANSNISNNSSQSSNVKNRFLTNPSAHQKQFDMSLNIHLSDVSPAHVNSNYNQSGLNQVTSVKNMSSDSSTVNMHFPIIGNPVILPNDSQKMVKCKTNRAVLNTFKTFDNSIRSPKRRQSRSLEPLTEISEQNNLNLSPNKERRMNKTNDVQKETFSISLQNGFVIPQSSNVLKPAAKTGSVRKERRGPSKSMESSEPEPVVQNGSIYDWKSDSRTSARWPRRPLPINVSDSQKTSTPRKRNSYLPRVNIILNDSMSTISLEIPNNEAF